MKLITEYWEQMKGILTPEEPAIQRQLDACVLLEIFYDKVNHLVGLRLESLPDKPELLKCRGLHFRQSSTHFEVISSSQFGDIFFTFVEDFYDKVKDLSTLTLVYELLSESLKRWKYFFDTEKIEHFSKEKEVGLFGELFSLKELLKKGYDALYGWTGSLFKEQDFQFPTLAVETKTIFLNQDDLRIHGENQLCFDGPLYLDVIRVNANTSGKTIHDLVEDILEQIDDPSLFSRKLRLFGYHPGIQTHYAFEIVSHTSYFIDENFPKISPPIGIHHVDYSILLNSIHTFENPIPTII